MEKFELFWKFLNNFENYLTCGIKKPHDNFEYEKFNFNQTKIESGKKIDDYNYFFKYMDIAEKKRKLNDIFNEIKLCSICQGEKKIDVPSVVNIKNENNIMVIYDNPINSEDFNFLLKWLQSIQISKERVYFTSIAKCYATDGTVRRSMADFCFPFLEREIRLIAPKAILFLGEESSKFFLKKNEDFSELRGKIYDFNTVPIVLTYHPNFVLKNIQLKREVWEDLKLFKNVIKE